MSARPPLGNLIVHEVTTGGPHADDDRLRVLRYLSPGADVELHVYSSETDEAASIFLDPAGAIQVARSILTAAGRQDLNDVVLGTLLTTPDPSEEETE